LWLKSEGRIIKELKKENQFFKNKPAGEINDNKLVELVDVVHACISGFVLDHLLYSILIEGFNPYALPV